MRMDQLAEAKAATEDDEIDRLFHVVSENSTMMFMGGPPGTGKTFTADLCIKHAVNKGLQVAFALPTGQQTSRMRKKYPDMWIDTAYGMLDFHKPFHETMHHLDEIDVLLIDEVFVREQAP